MLILTEEIGIPARSTLEDIRAHLRKAEEKELTGKDLRSTFPICGLITINTLINDKNYFLKDLIRPIIHSTTSFTILNHVNGFFQLKGDSVGNFSFDSINFTFCLLHNLYYVAFTSV